MKGNTCHTAIYGVYVSASVIYHRVPSVPCGQEIFGMWVAMGGMNESCLVRVGCAVIHDITRVLLQGW